MIVKRRRFENRREQEAEDMNEENFLKETIEKIVPADAAAMERASVRWNSIAKPLHSLGKLEDLIIKIAGIQRTDRVDIRKKALVVMCADNGVVEEGVTQTGQEVTAIVAENFLKGETSASIMSVCAGADLFPVDVGMITDVSGLDTRKILYGTGNIAKGPAMTQEALYGALKAGIDRAAELKKEGYRILATGEMGIGNTTSSSAMVSALLQVSPEEVTGRGAGLSDEGLEKKIRAIREAVAVNRPDPEDPLDVLRKVGGLDIAALTGLFLGGAAEGMPVIADGFISTAAALTAVRLAPVCREYILPSHVSKEPGTKIVLKELDMDPALHADMHLGEGTGAVALFPLLDMAAAVYTGMSTFEDIRIDAYEELS